MTFPTLSDKTSAIPIRSDLIRWCPSMDLIAFITDSDEVVVNRLAGHRVWANTPYTPKQEKVTPVGLEWRPDGKLLAVAYDNGCLQYLDVNDGKVVQQWTAGLTTDRPKLKHLFWTEHAQGLTEALKISIKCDARSQLPFLPPLPTSGLDRTFTSSQILEDLVHKFEKQPSAIQLLSMCFESSMFGFLVGTLYLGLPIGPRNVQSCVSSSDLDLHALICSNEKTVEQVIYQTKAYQRSGSILCAILGTQNEMQAALQYLRETIDCFEEEYEIIRDARANQLRRLCEASGSIEIAKADLVILLLVGVASEALKQWLESDVNERVLKKWEKTCMIGLEHMRSLISESTIPVSERVMIILSQLGRMTAESDLIERQKLDNLIDKIRRQIASLYRLLAAIKTEIKTFPAFCSWLVFITARLSPDDEVPDTPLPCVLDDVLQYIENDFPDGSVSKALDGMQETAESSPVSPIQIFPALDRTSGLGLRAQSEVIDAAARGLFDKLAESMKAQWHFLQSIKLIEGDAIIESRFAVLDEQHILWCLVHGHQSGSAYIVRHLLESSTSSVHRLNLSEHGLDDAVVQHMTFIDDQDTLLMVRKPNGVSSIVSVRHVEMTFEPTIENEVICDDRSMTTPTPIDKVRHLPADVAPILLVVNGRPGRRTGLYMQNDRQRYTVFDLDDAEDEAGSDSDSEMND